MTLHTISVQALSILRALGRDLHARMAARPLAAAIVLLGAGVLVGGGINAANVDRLQRQVAGQARSLEETRREAQREVNALAARLAELQAQANRLNALGERLTQLGDLVDGEFDFKEPIALGGVGPVQDMPVGGLVEDMDAVQGQLAASGGQLSVLEALLFDQELERNAMPSRSPVANGYVTSGYGGRADPFGGGRQDRRVEAGLGVEELQLVACRDDKAGACLGAYRHPVDAPRQGEGPVRLDGHLPAGGQVKRDAQRRAGIRPAVSLGQGAAQRANSRGQNDTGQHEITIQPGLHPESSTGPGKPRDGETMASLYRAMRPPSRGRGPGGAKTPGNMGESHQNSQTVF